MQLFWWESEHSNKNQNPPNIYPRTVYYCNLIIKDTLFSPTDGILTRIGTIDLQPRKWNNANERRRGNV